MLLSMVALVPRKYRLEPRRSSRRRPRGSPTYRTITDATVAPKISADVRADVSNGDKISPIMSSKLAIEPLTAPIE
jgi:hypothetical protein